MNPGPYGGALGVQGDGTTLFLSWSNRGGFQIVRAPWTHQPLCARTPVLKPFFESRRERTIRVYLVSSVEKHNGCSCREQNAAQTLVQNECSHRHLLGLARQ
jgi:hypothetical protein